MFKKVVTEEYPEDFPPAAPRYHGRHQLNRHPDGLEKCVGCELCAWACPADAIYVEGGDNTEEARFSPGERYGAIYQINYLRCIGCGLCVEACPTRSLTMTNFYELADDNRQDLIYTKEQLLAPLLPGMEQPPHPMRLGDRRAGLLRRPGPDAGAAQREDRAAARPGGGAGPSETSCAPTPRPPRRAAVMTPGARAARRSLLDPRPARAARGARHGVRPQRRALGAVPGRTMLSLGFLYMAPGALFLGFVQIIVYTGAVMMLFLFVLMLVGRDSSNSVVEVLRGQRSAALLLASGCGPAGGQRRAGSSPTSPVGLATGGAN